MTKSMTYAERLAAFAALAPYFVEVGIDRPSRFSAAELGDMAHFGAQECQPAYGHACDCCGTQRLKWLYPVALAGDMVRLRFIGAECRQNLQKRGLLKRGGREHYIQMEV